MAATPQSILEPRDVDHIIDLAAENICNGVIEEPRVYFDVCTLNASGLITPSSDPAAFLNGEDFPVRITRASFAFRPGFGESQDGVDETLLQNVGLRMVFHDQYYQGRFFSPLPLWGTQVVAGPQAISGGFSSYTFDRPAILSARDTLRVEVALEPTVTLDAPAFYRISVGFHGVGLQSKRPYFLASFRDVTTLTPIVLSGGDLRNDGAEPIGLTDMVVQVSAISSSDVGAGDVRFVSVQCRIVGNGTGRDWFAGPTTPVAIPRIPAQLLGLTQGRVLVHRFPGEGLLFEPGEGITVEANALHTSVEGFHVLVALSGYISLV